MASLSSDANGGLTLCLCVCVCGRDLGQQEVLQLLLLVRQQNHSTVSVDHSDRLHADVELQLDGPETQY